MSAGLYQNLVLERSRHPRFAGHPAVYDAHGRGANALCGDAVDVYVTRAGMSVAHDSHGCAIMAASADLMAGAVAGKTPEEIAALRREFETIVTTGRENPALGELNALAGVSEFASRIRCATLPWSALAEALGHG
jgi:nitrogen fixation NifU-like protein